MGSFQLNLNTVVLPAYWELVEPEEGKFDFSLIKNHIDEAKKRDLKLVFLWFGAMKNAKSTYAPTWVLADKQRFPRAQFSSKKASHDSKLLPLSIFNPELQKADSLAFSALTAFLADYDKSHTVIALQVQNEAGILGDSRDRSALANAMWTSAVPKKLMNYLTANANLLNSEFKALWAKSGQKTDGTWQQVFGTSAYAESVFMAWRVSDYINHIAAAGKKHKRLPMYANAWLGPQNPNDQAGVYPSGGPVPNVFDIYKATADSIDWLSPDIYHDDFDGWAGQYAHPGNPLFVPEAKFIVGNLFTTLGKYKGFGFSPFGIENGIEGNQISKVYGLLKGMLDVVVAAQREGRITSVVLNEQDAIENIEMGDYAIQAENQVEARHKFLLDIGVTFNQSPPPSIPQSRGDIMVQQSDVRPMALFIQLSKKEFLILGQNVNFVFKHKSDSSSPVEYAKVEEGVYQNGKWIAWRVLNGDERLSLLPDHDFRTIRIQLL
ncbi:DUF5597 domain-containing protein [Aliiglaciecola sp. NS0011-25]|uniref:GH35 family beta-galactosidase n=1 Tax=Aliiglaciecola sp. NS0011-25 TaxID=3127654 RepID=UPI003106FC91